MTGRSESRLTRMAVDRKVATLMLTLSIMVLGLVAWFRIPVELVPSGFSPPFLYVEVPTLRSAPRDIEQRVAEPFEAALRLVKGVERVETRIGSNSAGFLVALANRTNMDVAYNEVREQLDRARVGMGDEVLAYFVWKYNPSDDPVVWLGISTEKEGDQLAGRVQTSIVPQLERVEGVSRVELIGAPDDAVEVDFDLSDVMFVATSNSRDRDPLRPSAGARARGAAVAGRPRRAARRPLREARRGCHGEDGRSGRADDPPGQRAGGHLRRGVQRVGGKRSRGLDFDEAGAGGGHRPRAAAGDAQAACAL